MAAETDTAGHAALHRHVDVVGGDTFVLEFARIAGPCVAGQSLQGLLAQTGRRSGLSRSRQEILGQEFQVPGINQFQVNTAVGFAFSTALRSLLRQDPDIVMVGEIRDLETAEIAVQAGLTGHLVFSTLHTNTAVGAITRLRDMGIEPFLLEMDEMM